MAHVTYTGANWVMVQVDSAAGDYTTATAEHWTKVYLGSADKTSLLAYGQSIVVAEVTFGISNTDQYPRKRLSIVDVETEMRLDIKDKVQLLIDISQSNITDWTKALIILEHK